MSIEEMLLQELKRRMRSEEADESKKFAVEKKYNGFRALIHRKGSSVKIFSDQAKDITFPFPTAAKQALSLTSSDFILDCEMVPYDEKGNPLGRNIAAKYIGSVKSRKDVDDSNVIFYAFDLLYLDTDLTSQPWFKRRQLLQKLKFTDNIKLSAALVVDTPSEMRKAVSLYKNMKGSEGAIIKRYNGIYSPGKETDAWIKYRTLLELHCRVYKVNLITGTRGRNYSIGIDLSKEQQKKIHPKHLVDFKGKKLLNLGNTFNTSVVASKGDILDILVEEVWRHVYKNGLIRYSIHKPNVVEKAKLQETSTLRDLDAMVVSRGVEVKESEEEMRDEEGREIAQPRDFPKRMQDALKKNLGKWMPFVMQWHYRGHRTETGFNLRSLHTDFRMAVDDHLEGITILSPTSTSERVPDLVNAREWHNVRCVLKVPQPKIWLKVEGIMPRGKPGTTPYAPAVFVIVAKGKYRPLVVEDHKIVVEFDEDSGSINKSVFERAKKQGIVLSRFPGDKLKDLPKKVSFHIAHIGDKWIILSDEVS